nr:hypothetical protein [Pseudohalocynthiibacter aestuariivivens]
MLNNIGLSGLVFLAAAIPVIANPPAAGLFSLMMAHSISMGLVQ